MSGLSFTVEGFGTHCRVALGLRKMLPETLARRRVCKDYQIETENCKYTRFLPEGEKYDEADVEGSCRAFALCIAIT